MQSVEMGSVTYQKKKKKRVLCNFLTREDARLIMASDIHFIPTRIALLVLTTHCMTLIL